MMNCRLWSFAVLSVSTLTLTLAIVTREMREREFFRHLDAVNVDSILINRRLVDKYIKCLLKTGKCDPNMKDLRMSLPLILEHLCENRCSEKERRNLQKLFLHIRANRKQEWDRLAKVYDPSGRHKPRVEAFLENRPILPSMSAMLRLPVVSPAPLRRSPVTPGAMRRQPAVTQPQRPPQRPTTTTAIPTTTVIRR